MDFAKKAFSTLFFFNEFVEGGHFTRRIINRAMPEARWVPAGRSRKKTETFSSWR